MAIDYPFNDDLLRTPADQARAQAEYGPIAFALHFPALWELVAKADHAANRAKRRTRMAGCWAVALVTLALVFASSAPVVEHLWWSWMVAVLAAAFGILGAALGLGLHPGRHKAEWLENRLVTERLRQLHFQLLIELAPDILEAAGSGDVAPFERKRMAALGTFEADVIARRASVLEEIVETPEPRAGPCFVPMPAPAVFDRPHGALLLAAYRNLRILRQRQYADHKLLNEGGLFSAFPRRQAAVLGATALGCVLLLLVLHISSTFLMAGQADARMIGVLHLLAIWTALFALAMRTLEDGLKPHAEVERYRHYQAATRRILGRFDGADTAGRLAAAEELEQLAYDEMAIFLRAYHEAKFVM